MAMGQPSNEDDELSGGGVFSEINITPLTDIFLVLLIIFMVTSSVIVNSGGQGSQSGLKVNLPQGGNTADVTASPTDVTLAVLSDGRIVLEGTEVTLDELKSALKEAQSRQPNTLVIIQADEEVDHGKVVQVMETAKSVGLSQLAIGVREQPK